MTTALDTLAQAFLGLPMDDEGRHEVQALIAAAREERRELVEALNVASVFVPDGTSAERHITELLDKHAIDEPPVEQR